VPPVSRTEEEATGPDAMRRGLTFEFDQEFAAQDVEGFIFTGMGVRQCAGARRDDRFPQREGSCRVEARRFL
jgi:hypothetical protein